MTPNISSTVKAGPARRAGDTSSPAVMLAVLWAAVTIALAVPALKDGVFDAMSTDDAMRLVEVRDLIGGQGWFDMVEHRLDPPGGVTMHWSRVIDGPLAALILILRPLSGAHGAEAITLVLWPALLFGAALLLVAAIAKRMSDGGDRQKAQLAAVLLAALSVPALIHFRAGAIDHHNAQIVLLLAFALLTSEIEQSAIKACLAGFAASLSLAIGLEMLPAIAAACVAILGLLIWRGSSVSPPDQHLRRGIGRIVPGSRRGAAADPFARGSRMRCVRRAVFAVDRRRRREPDGGGGRQPVPAGIERTARRGGGRRSGASRIVLQAVSRMHCIALCASRSASDDVLARPRRRDDVIPNRPAA